jgi:uncharacterized protein
MNSETFWIAAAMVLVIEGLLPLLVPQTWRQLFERVLQMTNGQLRFYGLCSVLGGLALYWIVAAVK